MTEFKFFPSPEDIFFIAFLEREEGRERNNDGLSPVCTQTVDPTHTDRGLCVPGLGVGPAA